MGRDQLPPLLLPELPDNHLHLDAITTVDAGLGGCAGALSVVSDDPVLLDASGIDQYWLLCEDRLQPA